MRLALKSAYAICFLAILSAGLCGVFAVENTGPYQISLDKPAEVDNEPASDNEESAGPTDESEAAQGDPIQPETDEGGTIAMPDESVAAVIEKARQLYENEEYAETIKLLEPIIEDHPEQMKAWEILGWSYWRLGETKKTIDLWKDMAVIHGGRPEIHNMLGKAYISMDRLDQAIVAFENSLEIDPDQPDIFYTLGAVNRWAGNLKRAIGILAECHLRDPEDSDAKLQLAKALMSSHLYGDALPLWKELLAESPNDADIIGQLAKALLHDGDFDAAAETAGRTLELDPDNSYALEVLATLATHLDQPLDALEYQQRLLETQTDESRKVRVLGNIIEQDRLIWEARDGDYDLENAVDASEQLLEIKPNDINTHILLGEILMLQGKYKQAEEKLNDVLRHYNPNNIRVQRTLIEVYTAQKRFDKAENLLKKMESFNPRDPTCTTSGPSSRWRRARSARLSKKPAGSSAQERAARSPFSYTMASAPANSTYC